MEHAIILRLDATYAIAGWIDVKSSGFYLKALPHDEGVFRPHFSYHRDGTFHFAPAPGRYLGRHTFENGAFPTLRAKPCGSIGFMWGELNWSTVPLRDPLQIELSLSAHLNREAGIAITCYACTAELMDQLIGSISNPGGTCRSSVKTLASPYDPALCCVVQLQYHEQP